MASSRFFSSSSDEDEEEEESTLMTSNNGAFGSLLLFFLFAIIVPFLFLTLLLPPLKRKSRSFPWASFFLVRRVFRGDIFRFRLRFRYSSLLFLLARILTRRDAGSSLFVRLDEVLKVRKHASDGSGFVAGSRAARCFIISVSIFTILPSKKISLDAPTGAVMTVNACSNAALTLRQA